MNPTRVFLTDDHVMFRQGLRSILAGEPDFQIIGEASNGHELLDRLSTGLRPDVIILDYNMGEMDGKQAALAVRARYPGIKIVMLTAGENIEKLINIEEIGVSCCIAKENAASEMVKAVRDVVAGIEAHDWVGQLPRLSSKAMQAAVAMATQKAAIPQAARSPVEALTERELDVMHKLMQGCSNKEIARRLYISERTVQTHLSNIYSKMSVNSRTEAVLIAMQAGWVQADAVPAA
jgi:DNA-binding NarL/FixJ family response regulator